MRRKWAAAIAALRNPVYNRPNNCCPDNSISPHAALPPEPHDRPVDPLVLLHLVCGGRGPIFLTGPARLADGGGDQRDYRGGPADQHDALGQPAGAAGVLAGGAAVPVPVLRVELLIAGEGEGVYPGVLAAPGGDADCVRHLCCALERR